MSLIINDMRGDPISCKTHGVVGRPENDLRKQVWIGDLEISIEDFLILVKYVLTNTDLYEDDPRRKFVFDVVSRIDFTEGYNKRGSERLYFKEKEDEV